MAVTKLSDLVNPVVVADTISAKLPKAIKFSPVAVTDTTLKGQAGNTISVPRYDYIGDAADVAEGAEVDVTTLTAKSTQAIVKKVAKAVTLTDEAALSGTGDPINEATHQLTMSIASKVDNDILATLQGAATETGALTAGGNNIDFSLSLVSAAIDQFADEATGERMFLFVNPAHMGVLRTDQTFTHASVLGDKTLMTGAVGTIYGCEVVPSRKIAPIANSGTSGAAHYNVVLAKEGAVSLYLKREATVEIGRDIAHKETIISADEHYVTAIRNLPRIVNVTCKAPNIPSD